MLIFLRFFFIEFKFSNDGSIIIILAIGNRDLEAGTVEVARRDTKEKHSYELTDIENKLENLLAVMQDHIYMKALNFRDNHTTLVNTWEEFQEVLEGKGGFISAHWDGTAETEEKIQQATKATIRCIPFDNPQENGICVFSGKPSKERVLFAKAY